MAKYRVKPGHGQHSRFEKGARVTYQPGGEAFTPTKNELAQHGDKLEKVEPKKPQQSAQQPQQAEANKGQGQQADADQGQGEQSGEEKQSGEDNKSSGSESGNTSGKQE